MLGEIIMQKQYLKKISAMTVVVFFGFSIGQVLAAEPAALKLTVDRPVITMLPGDGGAVVRLASLDAMGQLATLLQDQTVSVTSGGAFSNVTKSAVFPKGLATVNFPVGGTMGVFKPTTLGVGTLQASFASPTSLQSNTLEIQVTNGQTTVEDDDISPFEMTPNFEFAANMNIKIRGGFSVNGGKRLAHGKAKRGDRINARLKILINPLHQNKSGKFFAVLRMEIPGQPDSWFDLGTWQPWVFGDLTGLGAWGGVGRVGHTYSALPSELELLDFDDETQNGFFQQFPAGTKFTAAGGYILNGSTQWHLGLLPLDID
jgi:hypothetical protein